MRAELSARMGFFMGMRLCAHRRVGFVVGCLLLASASLAADTVIKDARIEFADGRVIEQGSIHIRDGQIVDVQSALSIPGGWEVVDGKGLVVYPGFIDAYSTRGLKLPDAPAAGSPPNTTTTAPPTMWAGNRRGIRGVKAADCLNLGSYPEDGRKNGLTAALLCPGGGILRGSGALVLLTDDKQTPASFGMELSFRGTGGGGPGGGGGGQGAQGYPGSLLGFVALLRQTLYDAKAYAANPPEKKDPEMETIATVFSSPAIVSADTGPDIVRALALSNEFSLKPILYGAREGYRLADRLKGVPVFASMAIGSEPSVRESADGPPAGVLEDRKKTWQVRAGNISKLIGAGAKVAFSSEGDGAASYLASVRKLIGLGLDRKEALKAMTSTPAEILGRSDWGEIKPGAQANLTVMDGDFANEKSKVKLVFVAGKKFEVKS